MTFIYRDTIRITFFRKVKHKRAKRKSGGIFIFIWDSLKDGVSIIRNHFDTIIWLKLDRHFFGFDEDCYLSSVYLWSYESSIRGTIDDDLFEILQNDIFDFDSRRKLFIIGDFNARVPNKSDYVLYDRTIENIDYDYSPDTVLPRVSQDTPSNSHGLRLLDLCKSTSFRIANGRLGSDCGKGAETFVSRMGSSVIDYLLVRERE